jgi:hypothetical protein
MADSLKAWWIDSPKGQAVYGDKFEISSGVFISFYTPVKRCRESIRILRLTSFVAKSIFLLGHKNGLANSLCACQTIIE